MHGIILLQLKRFVVDSYGRDAWNALLQEADLDRTLFIPATTYSDETVVEIVVTAADLTGESPRDLQYEFGQYIVPSLIDTYGVHVDADWSGLELIENVEAYIHEALRAKDISEFAPPGLATERRGDDRVLVTYSSDRQLCDVARGILVGIGEHYDESWTVAEMQCMHDGHSRCELLVTREPSPGRRTVADEPISTD